MIINDIIGIFCSYKVLIISYNRTKDMINIKYNCGNDPRGFMTSQNIDKLI